MDLLQRLLRLFWNSDEEPKPGDLIEVPRGLYSHYAVYVGDGYVVHLTSHPDSEARGASCNFLMSIPTQKAMVKKEKLRDVAGKNKWIINNNLERWCNPQSPDDIVREAHALMGQEQSYNLVTQNCEHFATKLRYGKAVSLQVNNPFLESAMRQ